MKVGGFPRFALVLGVAALAVACNDSNILGTPQDIQVSPDALDFGRAGSGEEFAQVVTITNVGGQTLSVTDLQVDPPDVGYYIVGDMPSPEDPWELETDTWIPVEVRFSPEAIGDITAVVKVFSNDPDEPEVPVDLGAEAFERVEDTFTQGQQVGGIADILFVVDNSGSMSDDQTKLANSFSSFINWLVTAQVDYRIAITTTDTSATGEQGAFVGSPKILDINTPNIATAFSNNVQVGDNGSGSELGLEGSRLALSEPLLSGGNAGFLRNEARLYIVYVSDEEDQSPDSVGTYKTFFTNVKGGDPDKVFYAAIAGPPPLGCFNAYGNAESSPRYHDITTSTGGLFDSLCQQNFGPTLENLAFEVTAGEGEFFLSSVPVISSLEMIVNGALQPPDRWTYNGATNSVKFFPQWNPVPGAEVIARFEAAP